MGGLCAYHYLCKTFSSELCSKTHLQEKIFECWDSNLGLLVEKRERYPCSMPFPHPNSHKSPVCGEKRKRDRSWKSLPTQVASFHDKQLERDFDFEAWVGRRPDWVWHIQMKSCFASTRISRLSRQHCFPRLVGFVSNSQRVQRTWICCWNLSRVLMRLLGVNQGF